MRILIVCENSIDRPEFHVISSLAERGFDVQVVIGPGCADIPRLREKGLAVTEIRMRSRVDRRARRKLRELLQQSSVDLVHCLGSHKQVANALAATRGTGTPVVAYRGTMGHLNRWDPTSWLSYLNPRLSAIICASDAVRQNLADLGIAPGRLRTIYKGHDPDWYRPANREALAELGVPDGTFVIGCAARIRPLKGIPVLIEALRRMKAPDAHLLLVGSVDDPQVRDMAQAQSLRAQIHLVGHRDDAASLMGACDAFVMASLRREGMPRAIIEAMSQDVPAVVSDIGGMPELVIDGESGRVVPVSDSTALADALNAMRLDPEMRKSMGQRARERVESVFSVKHTVEQTAALYHELAGKTST